MRLLPKSRLYLCGGCSRPFLVLFGASKTVEKRFHPRIPVKDGMVARSNSEGRVLGPVIEMGRGGLAFTYIADKKPPGEHFFLDILSDCRLLTLKAIPVKAVSDAETGLKARFSNIAVRRCGLKFDRFTLRQKTLLRFLLLKYRAIETL